MDSLVNLLAMEDAAAKFLLAGHRGGGKTTELRRLEQKCATEYTVVWVDTDTALDKFNIGYAEVVVLIGITIVQRLEELGWKLPRKLEQDLLGSLARVTYQDKVTGGGQLELPKLFKDLGMLLKVGFQQETTKTREVRPALSEIINKVNAIIAAAEADKPRLLVIVDGLDRKDFGIALDKYAEAIAHHEQSRDLYQQLEQPKDVASRWYNVAECYRQWGKYEQALECQQHCLEIRQTLNELSLIAVSCYQLGRIYQAWGKYTEALSHYEQSRDLYQQIGKEKNVANQWYRIGDCYQEQGKYELALKCQQQCLELRRLEVVQSRVALSLYQLGHIYQSWDKYAEAIAHYEQSRALYATLDLQQKVANQLSWLAAC